MGRAAEDVELSRDIVPEWDPGHFDVPEHRNYHRMLVVRSSGITTRRCGRGTAYDAHPEDIHYGHVPTIRVPDNAPSDGVRRWILDHLDELENILKRTRAIGNGSESEGDPWMDANLLQRDLAQAVAGECVRSQPEEEEA